MFAWCRCAAEIDKIRGSNRGVSSWVFARRRGGVNNDFAEAKEKSPEGSFGVEGRITCVVSLGVEADS